MSYLPGEQVNLKLGEKRTFLRINVRLYIKIFMYFVVFSFLTAREMKQITRDFRLGFGSFVDKTVMPYVSTVPSK